MVDLHVHSTRSDGTYTPTQLVDYAMEKGLSAFALTDHDSVDGLDEAIGYARQLHQQFSSVPEVIPGIELSSEYQGQDVHIVGLYIDYHDSQFQKYLCDFVASRDERNHKMCTLLQSAGMDISYEKLLAAFPNSVITRAHYAKYM
ncbi:MAG: PHP domain-containing protein, partial [Acetatifactor sp.]|nr:PHP domain-containing protein [Acetatifactor sp.]